MSTPDAYPTRRELRSTVKSETTSPVETAKTPLSFEVSPHFTKALHGNSPKECPAPAKVTFGFRRVLAVLCASMALGWVLISIPQFTGGTLGMGSGSAQKQLLNSGVILVNQSRPLLGHSNLGVEVETQWGTAEVEAFATGLLYVLPGSLEVPDSDIYVTEVLDSRELIGVVHPLSQDEQDALEDKVNANVTRITVSVLALPFFLLFTAVMLWMTRSKSEVEESGSAEAEREEATDPETAEAAVEESTETESTETETPTSDPEETSPSL